MCVQINRNLKESYQSILNRLLILAVVEQTFTQYLPLVGKSIGNFKLMSQHIPFLKMSYPNSLNKMKLDDERHILYVLDKILIVRFSLYFLDNLHIENIDSNFKMLSAD